jgi:acyl-CoA synthetase (AMP-forming)/AMP-acid ligase II
MIDPEEHLRIGDYLDRHATSFPDRVALRDNHLSLTYAQLQDSVDRCARAMLACGVAAGERVAVLSPPRVDALVTFFAAARIGALWLGLNPRYQMPELQYLVGDARPKLLFAMSTFEGRDYSSDAAALAAQFDIERVVDVEAVCRDGGWSKDIADDDAYRRSIETVSSEAPALLVYTSGSSGRPKGVLLPHRSLLTRSRNQNRHFPVQPFPRLINPFPINHIAGMHFLTLYAFVGGGSTTLMERFRADDFVERLNAGETNVIILMPTLFQLIVNAPAFDPEKLDDLQWLVYAGAAMPRELVELLFKAECGVGLTYGLTETCGSVTYAKKAPGQQEVMAKTIGRAQPEGEVRVQKDDGMPCKPGETGEIQVRARYCMAGYFNRPEATAAAYSRDGWLRTGDTARVREDGNLEFVGRRSEVYKSGGYNVYPREIELALEEHPEIEMSAVVGVPDPLYDEVGWAYVLPIPGSELDADTLRAWCLSRLANYKVPKRFIINDRLPMLPVGKVDKVRLRAEATAELEGMLTHRG